MSNSTKHLAVLGKPSIPTHWLVNDKLEDLARLSGDIGKLAESLIDMARDMEKFANWKVAGVAGLWTEFYNNVRSLCQLWLDPLVIQLRDFLDRFETPWGDLTYTDFQQPYNDYRSQLQNTEEGLDKLKKILWEWPESYLDIFKTSQSQSFKTARPPIEILFEAIIRSRRTSFDLTDRNQVLQSLGQLDKASKKSPLSFRHAQEATPIGFVNCLTALYTKNNLVTGSTLVNWGEMLNKVVVNLPNRSLNLHDRAREIRQQRYTESEQTVLNLTINREVDWYEQELKRLKQIQILTPGMAKDGAARRMVETAASRRVECLKVDIKNQIGQSYASKSLEVKRKCPMCMTCFNFPLAVPGHEPYEHPDWRTVFEVGRPRNRRGCCSEPVAVVQGIRQAQLWSVFEKQTHKQDSR